MTARLLAPLLVLALIMPAWAASARATEDTHLLYQARFLGLPVGDLAIRFTVDDATYTVTMNGRATGLFWAMRGIRVHRAVSGTVTENGVLVPTRYRRAYREWEKSGETVIDFNPPDGVPIATRDGTVEDRVPPDARRGTLDPLSVVLATRRMVIRAVEAGNKEPVETTFPVFEGKLRYDVDVRVDPPRAVRIAGQPWRAREAIARFAPLHGFSEKHAEEWRGGGLRLTVTDHVKAIPLRLDIDQGWGAFDLVYVGRCGAAETPCPDNEVDPLPDDSDG